MTHPVADASPAPEARRDAWWFVVPLAVLALVGLCARTAFVRGRPLDAAHEADPVDAAWERHVGEFRELPAFREALARSADPGNPLPTLRALAMKGLRRLPDDALVKRVALLTALVGRVDHRTCAAIFRNSATPEELHAAFFLLDSHTLDAWVDIAARAAMAELQQADVPATVDQVETSDAVSALEKGLPPDEGDRLGRVLDGAADASDDEACWAARTLYGNILRIGEPYDRILARALVQS